jgi:hypothetical protein
MEMICPSCSRRNPVDATYCYFDGSALTSTSHHGPLQVGTLPFPRPFVFPNGEACSNFNQLVMGCQRNWALASELLCQGKLEPFFVGLGRLDLAQVAHCAIGSPDPDRALDQLLAAFPSDVLQPPKLRAEPTVLSLGQVTPGRDSRFDLLLVNQGMRLLYGAVASDCDWLVLGEGPGQSQKVFQTAGGITIPVQVLGRKLRAGLKPLEGHLCIDSSGGPATVTVRVEVPIQPFPTGVLAGALTPRDMAIKAKLQPKEAALLFEQGLVEQWYKTNGWSYPVQGPAGSGLGAVQQFFEALGLTSAPKVEISDQSLHLKGAVAERIQHRLKVSTPEKRPVFAHGWSDQPWLTVGQPQFQGPLVRLPLEVTVPPRPGAVLEARVTVRANGNQGFVVPVTLQIEDAPAWALAPSAWWAATPAAEAGPVRPVEAAAAPPAPPARQNKDPAPASAPVATFGMLRLIYWSGIIGGWSAFLGWLLAELLIGRWVGEHFLLAVFMVMMVGCALGAGVSQVEGLLTGQWQSQRSHLGLGLLGGFAGGLVGGLLGNLLYFALGQRFAIIGLVGRVLGWTLLGLAIGLCEGLLKRQWRQVRNGLIGGSLGGFLGGLVFNPVVTLIGSPVSSRAFAFVLLGLFVGLSLGLVQVLLKEAWLTVEAGFRPGRQLILSQEVTTMGTSEKASLIFIAYGARGVEPVHLHIRRLGGGTYVLEDNHSRSGTLVNGEVTLEPTPLANGDVIQLGINKVRFNERYRPRDAHADDGPARKAQAW